MATWVSYAMKPVKSRIPRQLSARKSSVDSIFGPIIRCPSSPTTCKPIKPRRLPPSILPIPAIFSLGVLQATREAPPKMAAVMAMHVGTIVLDAIVDIAIRGAALRPSPANPIAYSANLPGEFYVLQMLLPLTCSVMYVGLVYWVPIRPAIVMINPPNINTPGLVYRRAVFVAIHAVPRAPMKPAPAVRQVLSKIQIIPIEESTQANVLSDSLSRLLSRIDARVRIPVVHLAKVEGRGLRKQLSCLQT